MSNDDEKRDPDAPVLLNNFYTIREIANISEVPIKKINTLITWRKNFKDRKRIMDDHVFFDRETTAEILTEAKAWVKSRKRRDEVKKKKDKYESKHSDKNEHAEAMKEAAIEKQAKELDEKRKVFKTKPTLSPDTPREPGPNELEAIRERKGKADDFNITPSSTDHAAPKPEKPKKDYTFEEQRRGRTVQPCPAHTGKYCPKATSCPWWIEKVRGSDQGACSVKIIAVSLDEIAYGEEKE